ncbi:MAG: sigma-54 dependent transcriptional regulator [Pseudomonadota bacterium]
MGHRILIDIFPYFCQLYPMLGDIPLEFVFVSPEIMSIMEMLGRISPYDATVLLIGETGTGKELLARIIHQKSARRGSPFVAINCGVLSGPLFEDKLFGHEAGSFTGATKTVKGVLEMADKGTLFLDEVSEIPAQNQVDFLRVLEQGEFRKIGGTESIRADVRIIAATNKSLANLAKEKKFRIDLYYRLHVIPINVPPLHERKMDIPRLAEYFVDLFCMKYRRPKLTFSIDTLNVFLSHKWPGNVRELRNVVERLVLTGTKETVTPHDLPVDFSRPDFEPLMPSLEEIRKKAERDAIIQALALCNSDKEKVAELLAISPRTLRYKIKELVLNCKN